MTNYNLILIVYKCFVIFTNDKNKNTKKYKKSLKNMQKIKKIE